MVVVGALRAGFRVAARPHANVHGVYGRRSALGKWMAGEQLAQSFLADPPMRQRRVKASPAATMRRLQAQMRRRRDGGVRGEDGVGELEKRIGTSVQALLERSAKGAQEIGMFHNDSLCRRGQRAATLRDRSPSSRLKRKLRRT